MWTDYCIINFIKLEDLTLTSFFFKVENIYICTYRKHYESADVLISSRLSPLLTSYGEFTLRLQANIKLVPPAIPDRNPTGPKQMSGSPLTSSGVEAIGNEIYDVECLKMMNEYFYAVRIFPGQDPTHVYIGWVTTQYHLHSSTFNQSHVRQSNITVLDDYGRIVDRYVNAIFLL